ncbi:MAG TPA: response regulator [Gammaproteobacteria bacterium]|nr:response regulator [Gammaproteobacteria bacterium]
MKQREILVVEDDPDEEALLLRALKASNYTGEVSVARDGQEAIDYLMSEDNPPPRLIILDLKLPKMGGLKVLQALRVQNETRLIPVVVFTSSTDQSDILTCYDLGVNSFVNKPTDYATFKEAVGRLVDYWVNFNIPMPMERRRAIAESR